MQATQSLNDLYRDLIENSPKTVSLELPSEIGTGRIDQTTTKQGVIFADWKMNYSSSMNVQGRSDEEYIQIIFCLNEGVSWGVLGQRSALAIQKGESCIYRGHGKTEYMSYARQSDFHFKNIKIPQAYFSGLLAEYLEPREISAYERRLADGAAKITTTPVMDHILAELKDFIQYRGGLGYLFLEGKVLELLSIYLSEVLEMDILLSSRFPISRTDREALLEAKRLIDGRIAYAPSCSELAKQVHMSVSKFSKGFTELFGVPVHAYIIDQRLEKAASLLLESDLPVSQVAAMVGYAKPSNFAAAFKKKYGFAPRQYKENKKVN